MKLLFLSVIACALFAQEHPAPAPQPPAPAKAEPAKPKPATKSESLKYEVNWPSGLSLGEAILTSAPTPSLLNFAFQMDASIPGFSVSESVDSRATPEFCSVLLYKRGVRGSRKVDERTEFDQAKMTATRKTEGGGKSELSTPACAKDALAFLYFLRRELAAGRLPPQQKVYYGSAYAVSLKFTGTERIVVAGEALEAEKITASVKGPVTAATADLFFAKDAVRTPLLIRVPLKAGQFSLELIR
ncbi:MAG TPA: DUF3108 domain-containing protein [Bryobacteraceae bacterium]|nr:DUF3108 domain-containing protein [Bryobacteraceae bacterium]